MPFSGHFLPGLGIGTTSVEFDVQERTEGESKWSTWSLIKYAVRNIVGFSSAPLQMITVAGVLTLLPGGGAGNPVPGKIFLRPCAGGLHDGDSASSDYRQPHHAEPWRHRIYIAKIYEEVKGRPRYFIARKISGRKKTIKKDVSLSSFG